MRFTSYGSAIESLVVALKPARDEVYKKHYSTPRYFVEYNLVFTLHLKIGATPMG